jgi:hypothetical protein
LRHDLRKASWSGVCQNWGGGIHAAEEAIFERLQSLAHDSGHETERLFTFTGAAYNLCRLRNLMAEA